MESAIDQTPDIVSVLKIDQKLLLEEGNSPDPRGIEKTLSNESQVDTENSYGHPTPVKAAVEGREGVCRCLLAQGVQVDTRDEFGRTALMVAAAHGRVETCRFLLTHGAHVNATRKYTNLTALIYAAENGHEDVCRLLFARGAHFDIVSKYGLTALMIASDNGHTGVCNLLLYHGAQVDTKDENGWTALTFATDEEYEDVCSLLLDQGLILPQKNPKKVTKFLEESMRMFKLFKRFPKVPRDVRYSILLAGWKKEIKMLIKRFIGTGWAHLLPSYFQGLKNKVIDESAKKTLTKLKKMVTEALSEADNTRIRALLNQKTLEYKKIKKNLILFSQRHQGE